MKKYSINSAGIFRFTFPAGTNVVLSSGDKKSAQILLFRPGYRLPAKARSFSAVNY